MCVKLRRVLAAIVLALTCVSVCAVLSGCGMIEQVFETNPGGLPPDHAEAHLNPSSQSDSGNIIPEGTVAGHKTLSGDELGLTVASYTRGGKTTMLSAREVILLNSSLEGARNGSRYTVPSADSALSAARNAVVAEEADDAGITVTASEVRDYAKDALGETDYGKIAEEYGMDEDAVEDLLQEACLMNSLREKVTDGANDDDEVQEMWTEYVNDLLVDTTMQLFTLAS